MTKGFLTPSLILRKKVAQKSIGWGDTFTHDDDTLLLGNPKKEQGHFRPSTWAGSSIHPRRIPGQSQTMGKERYTDYRHPKRRSSLSCQVPPPPALPLLLIDRSSSFLSPISFVSLTTPQAF